MGDALVGAGFAAGARSRSPCHQMAGAYASEEGGSRPASNRDVRESMHRCSLMHAREAMCNSSAWPSSSCADSAAARLSAHNSASRVGAQCSSAFARARQAEAAKQASASAPPPRKGLGGLFNKKPAIDVPTIEQLCVGETASAELCKTLGWALRAPVDIAREAARAAEGGEDDGPLALAVEILETLGEAKNVSVGAGMSAKEMATCTEQVMLSPDCAEADAEALRFGHIEQGDGHVNATGQAQDCRVEVS